MAVRLREPIRKCLFFNDLRARMRISAAMGDLVRALQYNAAYRNFREVADAWVANCLTRGC